MLRWRRDRRGVGPSHSISIQLLGQTWHLSGITGVDHFQGKLLQEQILHSKCAINSICAYHCDGGAVQGRRAILTPEKSSHARRDMSGRPARSSGVAPCCLVRCLGTWGIPLRRPGTAMHLWALFIAAAVSVGPSVIEHQISTEVICFAEREPQRS